jgi:hypothetical protein
MSAAGPVKPTAREASLGSKTGSKKGIKRAGWTSKVASTDPQVLGVHRGPGPAGLRPAGHHPLDGPARVRASHRGQPVLALHLGVRAPLGGALKTRAAARARVSAWIQDYNQNRRYSAPGMKTPVGYEQALRAGQAA